MNILYNGKVRFTFYFNDFTEREFFFDPKEIDPIEMFIEINLAEIRFDHLHHLIIEFPNYVLFHFSGIYYKLSDDPFDCPNMLTLRAHDVMSIADNEVKYYRDVMDWMEDLYKYCAEVRSNRTQML